ncbi:MAG: alanine/glycine:cation symporter family protein [Lautropia sp.]|nr:alanine/glycine:cation symporter family protein [Lautropia sp.]
MSYSDFVNEVNGVLWGHVLIYALLAVGVYFSVRLGFLQVVRFPELIRSVTRAPKKNHHGITPIQALTTSLASRVGTGNIAGVAVAITTGGPGALFWMWVVAFLGMATAYAESALAQVYKVHDHNGLYRGGPAFYIARGLKAPWAGGVFSVALLVVFGLAFNAVQANSIAESMQESFGFDRVHVGIFVAVLAGLVIFGGVRNIARVAEVVVPFMALAYLGVALWVMIANISEVPAAIMMILRSAFGLEQVAGGVAGGMMAAMLQGVKRGLYSNEAGMGSAPNIAAVATPSPHHPSSQGFVQALGVFIDTLLICTATGVMILMSNAMQVTDATGTVLTQHALAYHIGPHGKDFVALAVFFFAFTSIIGNYSYAEGALTFLKLDNVVCTTILRVLVLVFILWGAYESLVTVFDTADMTMGVMALINLIAIVLLSGLVVKLTRDYFQQLKHGEPTFRLSDYPELKGQVEESIWGNKPEN